MDTTMKLSLFILTLSLAPLPLVYGMNPNDELLKATKNADLIEVLQALRNGANVNTQDDMGMTPLHFAAYIGHITKIESYPIKYTNTRFHYNVAKILLDASADVNAQNHDGLTALNLAIMKDNPQITELIKSYSELLQQIKSKPTKQLLTQAVDLDFVSLVKLLLKAGIKPDLHDLALIKQKYNQDRCRCPLYKDVYVTIYKESYATIGRMLLQHLRLAGNLQAPEHSTATKLYHWAMNLMQPAHSSTAEHAHGPISKSGLGLPEDIIHTIASFTTH